MAKRAPKFESFNDFRAAREHELKARMDAQFEKSLKHERFKIKAKTAAKRLGVPALVAVGITAATVAGANKIGDIKNTFNDEQFYPDGVKSEMPLQEAYGPAVAEMAQNKDIAATAVLRNGEEVEVNIFQDGLGVKNEDGETLESFESQHALAYGVGDVITAGNPESEGMVGTTGGVTPGPNQLSQILAEEAFGEDQFDPKDPNDSIEVWGRYMNYLAANSLEQVDSMDDLKSEQAQEELIDKTLRSYVHSLQLEADPENGGTKYSAQQKRAVAGLIRNSAHYYDKDAIDYKQIPNQEIQTRNDILAVQEENFHASMDTVEEYIKNGEIQPTNDFLHKYKEYKDNQGE